MIRTQNICECESISKWWRYSVVQTSCFYTTWRNVDISHITERPRCSHKWKVSRQLAQQTVGYKCFGIIRQLPSVRLPAESGEFVGSLLVHSIRVHMQMHQNSTSGVWYDDPAREEAENMRTQWYGAICKQAAIETCNQIRCCCWHCRWKELLPERKKEFPYAREQEKSTQILWNALALKSFFVRFLYTMLLFFHDFLLCSIFAKSLVLCWCIVFFFYSQHWFWKVSIYPFVCVCFGLHHTATRIYSANTKKKV